MGKRHPGTAAIYQHANGLIYLIRVVTPQGKFEVPVNNSSMRTCKRYLRDMFGRIDTVIVTTSPIADNQVEVI